MSEQLTLVPPPGGARRPRRSTTPADRPPATTAPVALVLVDTPLAHLDRPFEYLVPAALDEQAVPGARVRVRMAGRDHDGFLLERRDEAEHTGRLAPLRTVVSPEPVLTPQVMGAMRLVAARTGGTLADLARLAVPPRHARAERSAPAPVDAPAPDPTAPAPDPTAPAPDPTAPAPDPTATSGAADLWDRYPAGPALLRRLHEGEAPAAVWTALPGQSGALDWPSALAGLVLATVTGGRGAVVVVPDARDVDRVTAALEPRLAEGAVVRLTADLGPEARYRAFLQALRGHARVVVGTRAAAWAPVRDLGLLVCWDDGDDLHREPRAPYPHVREVLRARAQQEGAGLLLGALARSVEAQLLVETGVAASVVAEAGAVRAAAPTVVVAGEGWQAERDPGARTARIPSVAWRALHEGLREGPVLVQVPRQGYVGTVSCADCRTPLRCPRCAGPVGVAGRGDAAACRWCGTVLPEGCPSCGSTRRRAGAVGERRTAEELGRAFPGVRVVASGGASVVAQVGDAPALVVCTVGAEPVASEGYAAAALLDGWQLLERASLDAGVEALRRWVAAAALVRAGGRVALVGVPPHAGLPPVEALVRWDPVWLAGRELQERRGLGLPPVRRQAALTGDPTAVRLAADQLTADGLEVLGRVPVEGDREQVVVRDVDGALPGAVRRLRAARSARKAEAELRVQVDPADLL